MNEKNYSQRRACGLVGIDPRVYGYRSSRADDADLRHRMRELASERRRFGMRTQRGAGQQCSKFSIIGIFKRTVVD
jgi:hypothetical protein